ncbi:MAG TPA: 50S ribosomal protein L9 [Firmicutes bacterium]|nr:50S ribosomal protein L9 [Bacillota bacterium]
MDVILTQDVKSLGKKGDLVSVSEGYGRNYLIPKGLATLATKGAISQIKELKEAEQKAEEKAKEEAIELAKKLDGNTIKLKAKAGEQGKIFGSITANDVSNAIKKQFGVEVDRKKIQLETIKELGTFPAKLRIYPEVSAEIKVFVEAEE